MSNKSIAVLIVAAGSGQRFGSDVPKQYLPLLGKSVLRHVIDCFKSHPRISQVFVSVSEDHLPHYNKAVQGLKLPPALLGGQTRQETVRKAMDVIGKHSKPDFILIHDAARPLVDAALIDRVCDALQTNAAIVPALPVSDTLRKQEGDKTQTVDRAHMFAMQTPQGFNCTKLHDLHAKYANQAVTDDAALYEMEGLPIVFVAGERNNFKITTRQDFDGAQAQLAAACADVRTGQGYDVHKLVTKEGGRQLMIGGIEIAHDRVLEGHSDADVGLHAVTDALLACVCDGDIGMHFSPKDVRWKNADSAAFLRHAAELVVKQSGLISHVDLTIICEEPKIGPHREKIRARIADILHMPVARISVKATTTEGLGFTGRREGIAAQAVVTTRFPFLLPEKVATAQDMESDTSKQGVTAA